METIKAYFALTKPRVIELLLVAAIPAMLQADRGADFDFLVGRSGSPVPRDNH